MKPAPDRRSRRIRGVRRRRVQAGLERLEWRDLLAGDVRGIVFSDLDADGLWDPAEGGRPGVAVFLDNNRDGTWDLTEPSRTTNAAGEYEFLGLTDGVHSLRLAPSLLFQQTSPAATAARDVTLGDPGPSVVEDVDFGVHVPPPIARDDVFSVNEDGILTMSGAEGASFISIVSQPGDFVGGGKTYFSTPLEGNISVRRSGTSVSVSYQSATDVGDRWDITFAAPKDKTLVPGVYENVGGYPPFPAGPAGFDIDGQGRSCGGGASFVVRDISYSGTSVDRLAVDFTHHCGSRTAGMTGTVEYTRDALLGPGVLQNDSRTDVAVELVGDVLHGELTLDSDGGARYVPDPDYNGVDSFTYRITDSEGNASVAAATINVLRVNDIPQFTKGADLTVMSNAGPRTITGWATGISAGPSDEAIQLLTFEVVDTSNLGLFSTRPALAANGTLTFTPAGSVGGTATISVRLRDSWGGYSAAQTFQITVTPIPATPDARGDTYGIWEEESLTVAVLGGPTSLSLTSEPGDRLGGGKSYLYSPSALTTFTAFGSAKYVTIIVEGAESSDEWRLEFGTDNNLPFVPRRYMGVSDQSPYDAGLPRMDIRGQWRNCDDTAGEFTVKEVAIDAAGVARFSADFIQRCDGASAALRGTVQYTRPALNSPYADLLENDVELNRDPLTVTLVSGVSHGALNFTGDGGFQYTPDPNFSGTDSFVYRVTDPSGRTDTANAVLNVFPVNDAPSYTLGPDVSVPYNSAAQTFPAWATGISAGPNESSQTLTFAVTGNTNSTLFSVAPTVAADGTLRFTPATNRTGTATITLALTDNGGTTNGGVNAAPTRTFKITVNPNTLPTIAAIPLQTLPLDADFLEIPISIADLETPAASLILTASSVSPDLIPSSNLSLSGSGGTRLLRVTVPPAVMGTARINLSLNDGMGGFASRSVFVELPPKSQFVYNFAARTNGFQFFLSQPPDYASLNLVDYKNAAGQSVLGVADVVLLDAQQNVVPGNLIVNETLQFYTFVSTAGALPAGTYTVKLRSAADAFHTLTGEILDGNGDNLPGGDFERTFTTQSWQVVASFPHFSRGPGQALGDGTVAGLPLVFSDGGNISRSVIELQYDPELLDVTGVTLPPDAPEGSTAVMTRIGVNRVRLTLEFATALPAGARTVALLQGSVPITAASRYGDSQVLEFIQFAAIVGSQSPHNSARAAASVHVNAYVGDLGANGRYDSFDVQQASRLALRLDSGLKEFPLLDASLLGDFNGNGRVDSFDVQRLSRLALRLPVSEAPALPDPLPVMNVPAFVANEPDAEIKSPPSAAPENDAPRADVDQNGVVDAQDVLWAIYALERSQTGTLSNEPALVKADVNGDALIDSADVLWVIYDLEAAARRKKSEI